jgi:hypothetical protein
MRGLTCAAARRRLHALCDGELSVTEQIAVEAHVGWCAACAATLTDVRRLGMALRRAAIERGSLSHEEAAALTSTVMGRRKAEEETSISARVQRMFEDMHLVYAAIGASVATIVCVMIMLGMMRFATDGRPDSLAAMLDLVAMPGPNASTAVVDRELQARWTARFQAAAESAEEETVFTLAALVTRGDQLASLQRLRMDGHKAAREEAYVIETLLDAVSRARIEPDALDVTRSAASGMVWLVTRTTVRATRTLGVTLPLPPAGKKRTAELNGSTERLRA